MNGHVLSKLTRLQTLAFLLEFANGQLMTQSMSLDPTEVTQLDKIKIIPNQGDEPNTVRLHAVWGAERDPRLGWQLISENFTFTFELGDSVFWKDSFDGNLALCFRRPGQNVMSVNLFVKPGHPRFLNRDEVGG